MVALFVHETPCDVSDVRDTDGVPGADGALGAVVNERVDDHVPLPPALTPRTREWYSLLAVRPVTVLLFPFVIV